MPYMNEFDKSHLPKDCNLAWVYEKDLTPEWLELVPLNIKSIGEKRHREFAASRKALSEVCDHRPIEQLNIVDHSHLLVDPKLKVSLSPTRGMSAAISSREVKAIGIDIEDPNRSFNPAVSKFFLRDDDLEMSMLQLWCIKEAAFKALCPLKIHKPVKDVMVLKDLNVRADGIYFTDRKVADWNFQSHDNVMTAVVWVS